MAFPLKRILLAVGALALATGTATLVAAKPFKWAGSLVMFNSRTLKVEPVLATLRPRPRAAVGGVRSQRQRAREDGLAAPPGVSARREGAEGVSGPINAGAAAR